MFEKLHTKLHTKARSRGSLKKCFICKFEFKTVELMERVKGVEPFKTASNLNFTYLVTYSRKSRKKPDFRQFFDLVGG